MDTSRRLHLLAAGDLAAWPDLARDLERRGDAENAAEGLTLLHAQGHVVEAAQWLARVTDTDTLQTLRASLLALAEGWQVGGLRALTRDLLSGSFRLIPAGSFIMGSPADEEGRYDNEPQHRVAIARPFLLKTTPVTQAEWGAVMGDPNRDKANNHKPVERVSWVEAARFCDALCAQTGGGYRLPTEAEWEYACRAGTAGARYGDLDTVAWYDQSARVFVEPVGQKQPNAWGLYDMLGNVWEWCQDLYRLNPSEPERELAAIPRGDIRVIRGGAWDAPARSCRAAQRNGYPSELRYYNLGFRPAGLLR